MNQAEITEHLRKRAEKYCGTSEPYVTQDYLAGANDALEIGKLLGKIEAAKDCGLYNLRLKYETELQELLK